MLAERLVSLQTMFFFTQGRLTFVSMTGRNLQLCFANLGRRLLQYRSTWSQVMFLIDVFAFFWRLQKRILIVGLINLVFAPFIFVLQLIYTVFRYAEVVTLTLHQPRVIVASVATDLVSLSFVAGCETWAGYSWYSSLVAVRSTLLASLQRTRSRTANATQSRLQLRQVLPRLLLRSARHCSCKVTPSPSLLSFPCLSVPNQLNLPIYRHLAFIFGSAAAIVLVASLVDNVTFTWDIVFVLSVLTGVCVVLRSLIPDEVCLALVLCYLYPV